MRALKPGFRAERVQRVPVAATSTHPFAKRDAIAFLRARRHTALSPSAIRGGDPNSPRSPGCGHLERFGKESRRGGNHPREIGDDGLARVSAQLRCGKVEEVGEVDKLGRGGDRVTETDIDQKLEAMVQLGMANSRMKNFFDVVVLAQMFDFESELLARYSGRRSSDGARHSHTR